MTEFKNISILLDGENVKLSLEGDITELDFILGISVMFDRLGPYAKDLILNKLENIADTEVGYMEE